MYTEILFVCLGNICRSPAAEAIMRKKLEERYWPNSPVKVDMDGDNMKALMRLARTPEERAKLFCAADFMTRHPGYTTVPDPYYGGDDAFELALDLIEDACDGIIDRLFCTAEQ